MKRVIVLGGAGEVGFSIIEEFLSAGFEVLAPTRRASSLEVLKNTLNPKLQSSLSIFECDLEVPQQREKLIGMANAFRPDGVVASLGGWYQDGRLDTMSLENWNKVLKNNLTSHFLAAQTLLPVLEENEQSFYVMIGGGAALHPVPGSAHVSVAASAQLMLIKSFQSEYSESGVRFFNPILMTPIVTRSRAQVSRSWITSSEVGKMCVAFALTNQELETTLPIQNPKMVEDLILSLSKREA